MIKKTRPNISAQVAPAERIEAADESYRIDHQAPGPDGAPLHDLTVNQVYPKDVYETLHYYGTGDAELDRSAQSLVRQFRGKPDEMKKIYRAVPVGVRQINDGDWVTIVKRYAEIHAESVGSSDNPMWVIDARVTASSIFTDGNSILEWGYSGPNIRAIPNYKGLMLEKKLNKLKRSVKADVRDVIVCDLDGTLCSMEWRRHFVETPGKNDWVSFFAGIPFDAVVPEVKRMLEDHVNDGGEVIYVSARPSEYRRQTADWLVKHDCPRGKLIMRSSGDSRKDEIVKQEILDRQLPKDRILRVIDDRPQVQRMWEQNGLEVVRVTDPGIKPAILNHSVGASIPTTQASTLHNAQLMERAATLICEGWYDDFFGEEEEEEEEEEPSNLTDKQAQSLIKNRRIKTTVGKYCIVSEIKHGTNRVGVVMACQEDEDIRPEYREHAEGLTIYHATDVHLDPKLRGHGLGRAMYVECIKAIAKNGGGAFGPHYVVNRKNTETTDDAMNVWRSLYAEYGKSGPFILIDKS